MINFLYRVCTVFKIILPFFLLLFVPVSLGAKAPEGRKPVQSALVIEAETGHVLFAQNPDTLTYPASLTKMMTLVLLFDALKERKVTMNTWLKTSVHAAAQPPCRIGLRVGERIRVRDAMMALITKSANDVAVVVAENLAGSEKEFVRRMNRKAWQLGMRKTTFQNPSGLGHRHQRTTARDMATLAHALIYQYSPYYQHFKSQSFKYKGTLYANHNKLLKTYHGMDGIKTGYIRDSGFNLATSCVRHGRRLIAVVLGGKSSRLRDQRIASLLSAEFQKSQSQSMNRFVQTKMVKAVEPALETPLQLAKNTEPDDQTMHKANWSIQVGSFGAYKHAQRAAQTAFIKLEGAHDPRVKVIKARRPKNPFRALLVGLTPDAARKACAILKENRHPCLVLEPKNTKLYTAMR